MQEQCDASSEPEDYARSMDNIICPTMSATGQASLRRLGKFGYMLAQGGLSEAPVSGMANLPCVPASTSHIHAQLLYDSDT